DRPVAELLPRLEDLLDPDVLDPGLPQPPQVARRAREAVRVVDPHAVDEALPHELDDLSAQRLEHLRVLHADAGELADVEEAAVLAGPPVEVEELRPQQRVA